MKHIALILFFAITAHAQIFGSSNARRIYGLLIDPDTCSADNIQNGWGYVWDSASGKIKCQAGGNSVTVKHGSTTVGSRGTLRIVDGAGVTPSVSDDGSQISLQFDADTAVVQTLANAQAGAALHCRSTDLTDSYTCDLAPAWTGALTRGMCVMLDADTANDDGATLSINSLTPVAIKNTLNLNPVDNTIPANVPTRLCYNGTNFYVDSRVVAKGATALATTEIASLGCSETTATATGATSADALFIGPSTDITAVTGYVPSTSGGLQFTWRAGTDLVYFKACNWTGSAITPGAVTINWSIMR